jgi:hypothetical protein
MAAKLCVVLELDSGDEAAYVNGRLKEVRADAFYPVDLERVLEDSGLAGKPIVFSRIEIERLETKEFPGLLKRILEAHGPDLDSGEA